MPVFDERDLAAVLQPLKPYLDKVVLCGGWTLLIYRRWVIKDDGPLPMATMDLDLAVPRNLPVETQPLDTILRNAGFEANFIGSEDPSITYIKEGAPEIEFITARSGNRPPKPIEVQPGLKADPLRFVEVLLENSRTVTVKDLKLRVRVPTPEAYCYQKGLTFTRRQHDDKKAKDLAYIFELLHNFPALTKDLTVKLKELRDRHPKSWFTTFKDNLSQYFPAAGGDGVEMVFSQRPHPYDDMLMKDVTNGPGIFRHTVRAAFRTLIEGL